MKINFVWYWDQASQTYPNWRDGLRAALELIARDHEVKWYFDKDTPKDDADFTLFWDDSNSPFFNLVNNYKGRSGICLTTWPTNFDNLRKLDVVYCESKPIYEAVRAQGIRAILAFGTDTDFFKPDVSFKKDIEYFYPATFSPWKRQEKIANLGNKLTCIGTVQPDGQEQLEACKKNGVNIEIGYFPAEKVRDYYRRSKKVLIPAIHGSERTVLEAMANNILPEVAADNERARSYIREFRESGNRTTRDFVINNYSHYVYADHLLKGIMS